MRFNWAHCLVLSFGLQHSSVWANNSESTSLAGDLFKVKPSTCVTIREGRDCFTKITFNWRLPEQKNVCLVDKNANKVLKCWQNSHEGQAKFEFKSQIKVTYLLLDQEQNVLGETLVDVSWVYKASPRKRRWRIF